jgi:DNA-binding response OmpR family regulator
MISQQDILNARILIVDDQQYNVLLLEQILQDDGYTSYASTMDPTQVCALHRKHRYDLILLDLHMPVMDGFEVIEALKRLATDDYLPVLVITAQTDHKLHALAAGARDFVGKPFDLLEVRTRIRNMLEVRLLYTQLGTLNQTLENYNQMLGKTVLDKTTELHASEARFRRLTELSSDWYWEQDVLGKFTKVYSPSLGVSDMTSAGVPEHIREDQGAYWNENEPDMLNGRSASQHSFRDSIYSRTHADGSKQYLMVSGDAMFDSTGRFTGYSGTGKDVTKIKHHA